MFEEYSDSQRLDEVETAEDYNRYEEEQVFLDHEAEDYVEEPCDECGAVIINDDQTLHEDWCEQEEQANG